MGGAIDAAVVAVRGLVFLGALQAAGAAMFRLTTPPISPRLDAHVRRVVLAASLLLVVAVSIRALLEPARMAGSLSGVGDAFLWSLFMESDVAIAQAFRLGGAALLIATTVSLRPGARIGQWIAIGLIVVSFTAMGHTRAHASSSLLGGLLALHVAAAAYWLGALVPLMLTLRFGTNEASASVLGAFSTLAVRVVPVLLAAGVLLASVLLGSVAAIAMPYGRLVTLKLAVFALLIGLAAVNRYRWVPRLSIAGSRQWLEWSIAAELVLMLAVLGITAVMTTLTSPH